MFIFLYTHACTILCMFVCMQTIVSMQNIRRELAEKRFTAELNVDASWKFLTDVGCDTTQINMDSEDGKEPTVCSLAK